MIPEEISQTKPENQEQLFSILKFFLASIFLGFVIPASSLFVFNAIEEPVNLDKVMFYWVWWIAWGFFAILSGVLWQWFMQKNKESVLYRKMGWYGALIHNPQMGLMPSVPGLRWMKKGSNLFLVGIILFSLVGLAGAITNTFFSALPDVTEQQISPVGEAILSFEPAGGSEVFNIAFGVGLVMFFFRWLQYKEGFGNFAYWGMTLFVGSIVGTLDHLVYHLFRYGASETALIAVAAFGLINSILIMLTGSIILSWIFHDTNNLFHFLKTSAALSNDSLIIVTFSVLGFIVMFAVTLLLRKRFAKVAVAKDG